MPQNLSYCVAKFWDICAAGDKVCEVLIDCLCNRIVFLAGPLDAFVYAFSEEHFGIQLSELPYVTGSSNKDVLLELSLWGRNRGCRNNVAHIVGVVQQGVCYYELRI